MDIISVRENSKNTKERAKNRQLEDKTVNDNNVIEEAFAWLLKFNKFVYSSTGNRNYRHFERLLLLYTQNSLSSVEASNVSDAINLKNNINNILIFFHLYWLDIKQEITDHTLYLNKMSALLSVYIDMELKTSKQEIVVKILAALYIYLNNSEEHIFRVLLRIKHITEEYTQICNHIFMKSFTNLKIKTTSLTDVAYIRYLLVFKMWKKIGKISDKKKINKLALMLLGPRMPKLRDELLKFVPRPPMDQKNETLWLLKSNLFELKQTHKHFLLFEDKMDKQFLLFEDQMDKHLLLLEDKIDKSADLQYTTVVYADRNNLKFQKQQMSLKYQSNSNKTSNREVNKDYLNGSRNNNIPLNIIKGNKSSKQTHLQKNKRRGLKSLKKIRKKPGKTIVIDLTGDEISVPCEIKKNKHNLEYLKIMKSSIKNKKLINPLKKKHSSGLMANVNIEKNSNRDSKSVFVEKICLEHKSIPNDKNSDSTENYTPISNISLLNNIYHINKKSEHLNVMKNQVNNTYSEFVKEDKTQFDYNRHYLKSSTFVNQDIKESKVTNVSKKSKSENHDVPSRMTFMNAIGLYNNTVTQSRETLTSQEESIMNTIPLLKICQNDIMDQHSFKQEIPISTNCNATQKSYKCWKMMPHDIKHLRMPKLKPYSLSTFYIQNLKSNDDSQITDYFIQKKVCHQVNECEDHCTKIDYNFVFPNKNDSTVHNTEHNTFAANENNAKLACDTNIIYTLCDCNTYYVVHRIDDIVSCCNMHPEKRMQCLHNSNDMYTVPPTFINDQIVGSSLDGQNVNLNNKRKYDYGHDSKHSETMIKAQQGKSDCDTSMSNDRLHLSEHFFYDIDSIDMDSKEANEIMKTCINDENISFSHQIEILKILKNVASKETTDFLLSSKQSPFELDNVHTNTFLSEKDILCNNQNNAINSNVNPIAFHLNNITSDDTFL